MGKNKVLTIDDAVQDIQSLELQKPGIVNDYMSNIAYHRIEAVQQYLKDRFDIGYKAPEQPELDFNPAEQLELPFYGDYYGNRKTE